MKTLGHHQISMESCIGEWLYFGPSNAKIIFPRSAHYVSRVASCIWQVRLVVQPNGSILAESVSSTPGLTSSPKDQDQPYQMKRQSNLAVNQYPSFENVMMFILENVDHHNRKCNDESQTSFPAKSKERLPFHGRSGFWQCSLLACWLLICQLLLCRLRLPDLNTKSSFKIL